jgi:hypothetical protein
MRLSNRIRVLAVICALGLLGPLAPAAFGHAERQRGSPTALGEVPEYRTDGPALVVCKDDSAERFALLSPESRERNETLLAECEFEHIQEASTRSPSAAAGSSSCPATTSRSRASPRAGRLRRALRVDGERRP